MKAASLSLALGLASILSAPAWACPKCRPLVEAGIHNAYFARNAALMALPLLVLLAIGAALYFVDEIAELAACKARALRSAFGMRAGGEAWRAQ